MTGSWGGQATYLTTKGHKADIEENKVDKCPLTKHTGLYHLDKVGDTFIYGVSRKENYIFHIINQIQLCMKTTFSVLFNRGEGN